MPTPFVIGGKNREGITIDPKTEAETSKILNITPNGDVFASHIEAHISLGRPVANETRVGHVLKEDFLQRLKKGSLTLPRTT